MTQSIRKKFIFSLYLYYLYLRHLKIPKDKLTALETGRLIWSSYYSIATAKRHDLSQERLKATIRSHKKSSAEHFLNWERRWNIDHLLKRQWQAKPLILQAPRLLSPPLPYGALLKATARHVQEGALGLKTQHWNSDSGCAIHKVFIPSRSQIP